MTIIDDLSRLHNPVTSNPVTSDPVTSDPVTAGTTPHDDGHLLQICLELQLDALLLLVAGSATAHGVQAELPWRRWLAEDLDAALDLTSTATRLVGVLPLTSLLPLTSAAAQNPPAADTAVPDLPITEQLRARYSSMGALLADVIARRTGDAEAPRLRSLQERYDARVAELRPSLEPPAAHTRAGQAVAHRAVSPWVGGQRRPYIPGEWLG